MHAADVLLVLSAPGLERYLPSKLFEYLASRRPVLIFGTAGESSALVEQLGAGLLCTAGSGESLGAALQRLRELDLSAHEHTVVAWLKEHRRDALSARAFEIMEGLTAHATGAPIPGDEGLSAADSQPHRRLA